MKKYTITFFITLFLTFSLIFQYTFISYASTHGGGGGDDHGVLTEEEKKIAKQDFYNDALDGFVKYGSFIVSQFGAIVIGHDFSGFLSNYEAYKNYVMNDWKDIEVSDNGEIIIPKELIAIIKQCLDEYAKQENSKEENGGFYLLPTTNFEDVSTSDFQNSYQYRTFRNIVTEKGVLPVMTNYRGLGMRFIDPFSDPDHPILLVGNVANLNSLKEHPYLPVSCTFYCADEWTNHSFTTMTFHNNQVIYTSVEEGEELNSDISTHNKVSSTNVNYDIKNYGVSPSWSWVIYSTTGERVRVFVSQYAAQNYSVGNRKIYFSENYYNYVPEDLTVSIDDLQKSVDDLQKIIDELLKKINDQTSEKEIEELLRQILEELRKNPGGGEGSGSGGNVTVDVDLSTTNSWLSKIYTRLGDILSKMSETAGQSMSDVVESIKDLKEMLNKYLNTITSDLGDIKDQLEDMTEEEFSEKSDSFLNNSMDSFSEIGELAKTKFPLSIPYDLYNLLAVISPRPSEASIYAEQTAKSFNSPAVYQSNGKIISVSDGAENDSESVQLSSTGAPVFHLPIVVESVGWDYAITVDMSRFQTVANLSRTFFTLIFILGLINLTIKIAGLWGDIID